VLPVQVSADFLQKIFEAIEANPDARFEVNLPEQMVTILSTGEKEGFDINGYKKDNMLNGFDDIDFLLNLKEEIKTFEREAPL
jgi:3-isopropylmalate/(R)-2-methylmalate dehydratase small subunit